MQWQNYHPEVCTAHLNSWQTLLQEWTVDQHWHTNATFKANCWASWYSHLENIAAINVHKKYHTLRCATSNLFTSEKYLLSSIRMISLNPLSLHFCQIIHFLSLHSYVLSSSYYEIYKQRYLYVALFLSSFQEIRLHGYTMHITGTVDTSL